jgi:hypothetical protein
MNQTIAKNTTESVQQLSLEVIGALADALKVDFLTIKRWIAKKDIRLTSEPAKEVFERKGLVWDAETATANKLQSL